MLRKNVSISTVHLRTIDPIMKKHNGNLSATIREIIEFTGFIIRKYGSIEKAKEVLSKETYSDEHFVDSIYGVTIPLSMFRWLLKSRDGTTLPILEEVTQLFMPIQEESTDIFSLVSNINEKNSILNWPLYIKAHIEDEDIIVLISGSDTMINRFEAMLISMFVANMDVPLKINNILKLPSSIQLQFCESNPEEARKMFQEHYGNLG